tara:strand:- start:339 stop:779 length:441 start_codon:yes stop_codon:yes gene_type:complete
MAIKSFRGKIAHDTIDTISLHTNNGSTGYKIVKFEIMPENPTTAEFENVVKIFSVLQATTSADIDFNDQTLLAAAFTEGHGSTIYLSTESSTVFDNMVVNQDIYVTNNSPQALAANYYIELEQMQLDLNENTVATLKDIRNIKSNE